MSASWRLRKLASSPPMETGRQRPHPCYYISKERLSGPPEGHTRGIGDAYRTQRDRGRSHKGKAVSKFSKKGKAEVLVECTVNPSGSLELSQTGPGRGLMLSQGCSLEVLQITLEFV